MEQNLLNLDIRLIDPLYGQRVSGISNPGRMDLGIFYLEDGILKLIKVPEGYQILNDHTGQYYRNIFHFGIDYTKILTK